MSRLECLMELVRPYWRKIWTCDVLLQNLFRKFSPPNRRNGACLWQQTCCSEAESHENFMGQVMAFMSFSNHPTPLTWLRVTFGCSPSLKWCWKGRDLKTLTQLRRMRQVRWTPFQKTLSKNVSGSGRTAGNSVSTHKESILKIIEYFWQLTINCNFHSPSLGTFWSHLVHSKDPGFDPIWI